MENCAKDEVGRATVGMSGCPREGTELPQGCQPQPRRVSLLPPHARHSNRTKSGTPTEREEMPSVGSSCHSSSVILPQQAKLSGINQKITNRNPVLRYFLVLLEPKDVLFCES